MISSTPFHFILEYMFLRKHSRIIKEHCTPTPTQSVMAFSLDKGSEVVATVIFGVLTIILELVAIWQAAIYHAAGSGSTRNGQAGKCSEAGSLSVEVHNASACLLTKASVRSRIQWIIDRTE